MFRIYISEVSGRQICPCEGSWSTNENKITMESKNHKPETTEIFYYNLRPNGKLEMSSEEGLFTLDRCDYQGS